MVELNTLAVCQLPQVTKCIRHFHQTVCSVVHQTATLYTNHLSSRHDGEIEVDDVPSNLPGSQLQELSLQFYRTKIYITSIAMKRVELLTSRQGSDETATAIWKVERRLRITSSNVKSIVQRRPTTASAPLVQRLLYNSFKGNAATRYGLAQERVSSIKYLEWLTDSGSVGAAINRHCGLIISPTHPWLAATPDAWVKDPSASPPQGLVEFKNPFSYKDLLLREAVDCKQFSCLEKVEGSLSLKRSHEYFHQIQFAMFCTGRKWCDIFIRAKDSHCERIQFDEQFCLDALPKLKRFFFCAILPELTVPHQPIREPKEWIADEDNWMSMVTDVRASDAAS